MAELATTSVGPLAVTWRPLVGAALVVAAVATAGSLTYSLGCTPAGSDGTSAS